MTTKTETKTVYLYATPHYDANGHVIARDYVMDREEHDSDATPLCAKLEIQATIYIDSISLNDIVTNLTKRR
jgi:hypothetical protein